MKFLNTREKVISLISQMSAIHFNKKGIQQSIKKHITKRRSIRKNLFM